MFSQSITVKLFKAVWNKFNKSAVYALFIAFAEFILKTYQTSFLKKDIDASPFFNLKWNTSLFAGIFDKLYLFVSGIIVKTGKLIKKITHNSLVGVLYRKISKRGR